MVETVFYAWQSDLPNTTNRTFIRTAIDKAIAIINLDFGIFEPLRGDQDTQGVPGDINIAEVIFEKIAESRIFVADITTVTRSEKRPSPNPNVLIEYGRASILPGSSQTVTVFNEAFGSWENDRPFDMRHRRKPVTFQLPEQHSSEERSEALDSLSRQLADIFAIILTVPKPTSRLPEKAAFDSLRQLYFGTLPRDQKTGRIIGIFCAAIPLSDGIEIVKPWEDEKLVHRLHSFSAQLGTMELNLETVEGANWEGPFTFKPIQNGAMGRYDRRFRSYNREREIYVEDVSVVYVHQNGQVVSVARTTELAPNPMLNIRWILAEVANTLYVINKARIAAKALAAQYAMLIELRYDDQLTPDTASPVTSGEWRLCPLPDEQGHAGRMVTSEPKTFGPFLIEAPVKFPSVLSEAYIQIETSIGRVPERSISFEGTVPMNDGLC